MGNAMLSLFFSQHFKLRDVPLELCPLTNAALGLMNMASQRKNAFVRGASPHRWCFPLSQPHPEGVVFLGKEFFFVLPASQLSCLEHQNPVKSGTSTNNP